MRLLLLHVGAPIASILVTSRFATSFQELRAVYWQEKRDAMAWFSAVVQDVRSRSNGLRESCLAVVWSLQKDLRWSWMNQSFLQHSIWIGHTKEFENRQRHWDEVGKVSFVLYRSATWIVQLHHAIFPKHPKPHIRALVVLGVSLAGGPCCNWRILYVSLTIPGVGYEKPSVQSAFLSAQAWVVDAVQGSIPKFPNYDSLAMTKSENNSLSMFELSRHLRPTFTLSLFHCFSCTIIAR